MQPRPSALHDAPSRVAAPHTQPLGRLPAALAEAPPLGMRPTAAAAEPFPRPCPLRPAPAARPKSTFARPPPVAPTPRPPAATLRSSASPDAAERMRPVAAAASRASATPPERVLLGPTSNSAMLMSVLVLCANARRPTAPPGAADRASRFAAAPKLPPSAPLRARARAAALPFGRHAQPLQVFQVDCEVLLCRLAQRVLHLE